MKAFRRRSGTGRKLIVLRRIGRAAVLLLGMLPLQVHAHSFTAGLVLAGPSGAAAAARDGFLRATRERDAHAGMESDGHLGGLDVYLRAKAVADGRAAALGALRSLVAEGEVDLIGVIGSRAAIEAAAAASEASGVALVAAIPAKTGSALEDAAFVAAFMADFGYPPSPEAAAGYAVARLMDAVVRATNGDLSKRGPLCAAFAAAEADLAGRLPQGIQPALANRTAFCPGL